MGEKRFVICKNCGGEFVARGKTAMYCVDCRPIMQRKRAEQNRLEAKKIKKPQCEVQSMSSFLKELDRYNEKNGTHLTYGQYVAMTEGR